MSNNDIIIEKTRFKPFVFYGYSMMPCLNPKKVHVVLARQYSEYKVGDVVAIKSFDKHFQYIIHRIVYVFNEQNKYITKGDNNLYLDKMISYSDIVGKADKYISKNQKSIKITHSRIIGNISRYEELVAKRNMKTGKVLHKLNKFLLILIMFCNRKKGV